MAPRINYGAACAALFYVTAIYASSGVLRGIQQWIQGALGEHYSVVMSMIAGAFVLLAMLWLVPVVRREPWRLAGLMVVAGIYAWVGLVWLTIPEERLHLPQYGVLAVLLWFAFRRMLSGWALFALVFLLGTAAGAGDELVQHWRSNRVGDWRDVWLNTVSSGLAALALRCSGR